MIVIGYTMQDPTGNEDEHLHAQRAFQAATEMLGLQWNITFNTPPANFKRNRPPDANWPLPQDLLNFIDQSDTKNTATDTVKLSKQQFELFGKINDCKALAILVTP